MTIAHTLSRDVNGNKRVKILVSDLGAEYEKFVTALRVPQSSRYGLDTVIAQLQARFGYRYNKKAAAPSVSAVFDTKEELQSEVMDAFVFSASEGKISISRQRYMFGVRRASHHEYYKQFATAGIKDSVRRELPKLIKCRKKHLNDHGYTHATGQGMGGCEAFRLVTIANATTYANYKSGFSASDVTCVLKAEAREQLASYIRSHEAHCQVTEVDDGIYVNEYFNGYHLSYKGRVLSFNEAYSLWKTIFPYRRAMDENSFKTSIKEALYLPENKKLCV